MSKELMYTLISKMHIRLNELIVKNNFNLQSQSVQNYSKRLDRVLSRYNKILERQKGFNSNISKLDQASNY